MSLHRIVYFSSASITEFIFIWCQNGLQHVVRTWVQTSLQCWDSTRNTITLKQTSHTAQHKYGFVCVCVCVYVSVSLWGCMWAGDQITAGHMTVGQSDLVHTTWEGGFWGMWSTSSPYVMSAPDTLCIICCCASSDINSLVCFASDKALLGRICITSLNVIYFTLNSLLLTHIHSPSPGKSSLVHTTPTS